MAKLSTLLLLLPAMLASCSEEQVESLYPQDEAKAVAIAFVSACIAGDAVAARAAAGTPFRFRTRDWSSAAELDAELPRQLGTIKREAGGADTCEVWPYARLHRGEWPRAEKLSVEESTRRLGALGVDPNGFLVRLVANSGGSVTLRVGPDAAAKLVVSGFLTVP